MIRTADDVVRESMTAEEYDAMRDAYKADYAGVYDFANMSVDEIERMLTEEIAADAYAGLNFFYGRGEIGDAIRAETQKSAPAQRAETQQRTTGPPGRTMVEVARESGNIRRNNIEYADNVARNTAQKALHDRMVSEGKTIDLTENREAASQYFPDLRSMPKVERKTILREKIKLLKEDLRTYLRKMKGASFEFEINGETIEAKLYNTGIQEVLENLTQEKSGMLFASEEIFKNAEYLYSTTDKKGNPEVSGWDYFYVPVKLGDDTVGVRIAVRNMIQPNEAQIYNWGIKKEDASLDGGGPLPFGSASTGASSDASSNERNSSLDGVGLMPKGRTSADVSSDVSSTDNIRAEEGNSQEKSSGKASVEVENRAWNNEIAADAPDATEGNAEADKRREWFRKMAQQDRQEAARLMRKDETLARANREYGRPAPDKGAGQVYRAERDHGPDAGDRKRCVVIEKQPVDTRTLRTPDLLTSFREPRRIPAVRNGTLKR